MKAQTFSKLYVCFPISLHIVGLKWVLKLLKSGGGVADYNLLYVLYQKFLKQKYFVLICVVVKE